MGKERERDAERGFGSFGLCGGGNDTFYQSKKNFALEICLPKVLKAAAGNKIAKSHQERELLIWK